MQTFLPFAEFVWSAEVLDDRRLGKQRVETLQILRALHCEGYGWANHPAVTMWQGHTPALVCYGTAMVDEWEARGFDDTTRTSIAEFVHPIAPRTQTQLAREDRLPRWLGREPLHRSHRSALLRKDPEHYGRWFQADTPADLEYVWPVPPQPRGAQPGPGRRTAWVVRGEMGDDEVAVEARAGEELWVPLDARSGGITKRARQVARLVDEMAPGDLLVVPHDRTLRVGEIAGDHRMKGGRHVRPVRWIGALDRPALRFPAALQDPQVVFALHDEPAVARLRRRHPTDATK